MLSPRIAGASLKLEAEDRPPWVRCAQAAQQQAARPSTASRACLPLLTTAVCTSIAGGLARVPPVRLYE